MKKFFVVIALLVLSVVPARAETVRTCSTVYGSGEVCGETTITHTVAPTGVSDNQVLTVILGLFGAAVVSSILYKLTYKSYILG
jgi:hypothetical protein